MTKKNVFVTGAAGFIGFHVCKALKARWDAVVGLDNFNAYYSTDLKRARASLLREQGVEMIEGDVNDRQTLKRLFEKHSFTHVIHLAAQAGVRYARQNPEAYLESNICGFLSILEVLRLYPTTYLVYASSSSVYGCNTKIPFSVADKTDQPANLYAATKKANELMAYSYNHLFGIRSAGLRFFTVYGPWGRPDMAYYSFTKAIFEGKPIHLFNQGKMERDFTYIDDIIQGTLAALDHEGDFEIFNLGNNQPMPILTFVSILEKLIGKEAIKIYEGETIGEVAVTYADISETEKKLKFKPTTNLETGLAHFVDWYQSFSRADTL
jgi:UDP-glucuronate 4-epimerase